MDYGDRVWEGVLIPSFYNVVTVGLLTVISGIEREERHTTVISTNRSSFDGRRVGGRGKEGRGTKEGKKRRKEAGKQGIREDWRQESDYERKMDGGGGVLDR